MQKKLIALALCLLALAACKKKEEPTAVPPSAPAAETATHETAAPPPATPQPTVTLAAGAPIPAQGVALWLVADDAQPGKLASWTNSAVAGVVAAAATPEEQPGGVAKALNGHNVARFAGEQTTLMPNAHISPARTPEPTIFAASNSKTEA